MQLGYWNIKGIAEPLRIILAYFKLEYTEINPQSQQDAHDIFAKHHFTFPNLPFLIDGDVHITESSAIPIYLAQKAKVNNFFGNEGLERVHHAEIMGVIKDIMEVQSQAFWKDDHVSFLESKKDVFVRKFGELSNRLGDKNQFYPQVTQADIMLFITVSVHNLMYDHLKLAPITASFPNLKVHSDKIANLPGIKEHLASEKAKRPIMPPAYAKIKI